MMDGDFTAYWGIVIYCGDGALGLSGIQVNPIDGLVEVLENGRMIVSVGTEGLSDRDLRLLEELFPPESTWDYSGAIYEDQP
jgi:hypothetical protein